MRRPIAILAALLLLALAVATAATAAKSDRDRGVRPSDDVPCETGESANDNDNGGNGNGNGGGGNGNGNGNGGGNGGGNGNGGTTGTDSGGNGGNAGGNGGGGGNANAGGNGNGNAGTNENAGNGNSNAGGNGNGNAGGNGHGNGNGNGNGRGGRGNAGSAPCVDPPADPTEGSVAGDGTLPPAVAGKTVNVEPTAGDIRVKQPGADGFEPLAASAQLPEGSVIDSRDGTVDLTSATGQDGGQQTAAFTGAKFEVRQATAKTAVTELVLRGGDFDGCRRLDHGRRAQQIRNGFLAARGARRGRGLWGSGKGRFRSRGRWGSATVRGTVWHVEDTCEGTLTTVKRGVVQVADFGLDRQVSVRAGESYLARVRR